MATEERRHTADAKLCCSRGCQPLGLQCQPHQSLQIFPKEKKIRSRNFCFRALGGCKVPYPGRNFEKNEILEVVAAFIAGLDMKSVTGDWELLTTKNKNAAAVIVEPYDDIQVDIKMLQGFEDVRWAIGLHKSEIFLMVTEISGMIKQHSND